MNLNGLPDILLFMGVCFDFEYHFNRYRQNVYVRKLFSCQNMYSIQHHPMMYSVGYIQHQTISNSDYMIFIIANISKIHHHLTNFTNEMEFRPVSDRRHHAQVPLSLSVANNSCIAVIFPKFIQVSLFTTYKLYCQH